MSVPGERLRRLAARVCAAETMTRLIDPIVGHISARTSTRWGRRLPYLYVAPLFLGGFLFGKEWLRRGGLSHSPERFRRWVETAYTPGRPSRQYWECNPYPLKVVTSRGAGGSARVVESWSADRCPPKVAERIDRATR